MKRKIFSTLLFGALAFVSLSTVTSCKDYDDDINNLQGQIDKMALKTDVDALKSQLEATKSTAESALAKANANETEIAKVKATAEQAGKDVADAVKAAAEAKSSAADAAAAAKKAQETADAAVKAAADNSKTLEEIGKWQATVVTTDVLAKEMEALETKINEATEEQVKELTKVVKAFDGSINALYSAVTEVSLVGSFTNGEFITTATSGLAMSPFDISFVMGKVGDADVNFGKDMPDGSGDDGKGKATDANEPYKYTKDSQIDFPKTIVVRINPVNANITPEMIKLIDSEGNDLDKTIAVKSVSKYEGLLSRATATGLWTVELAVADGVAKNNVEKKVANSTKHILYAMAVNNTAAQTEAVEDAANRYVVSTYDITIQKPTDYVAPGLDKFKGLELKSETQQPKWTSIKDIKNRTNDQNTDAVLNRNPNTEALLAASGENIYVRFNTADYPELAGVDRFYVVRDDNYAEQGSSPSEINVWNTYTYTGLGDIVEVKNGTGIATFTVTIPANLLAGDEVCFRIYAINYDGSYSKHGTKDCSKGIPFSVKVVNPQATANVTGEFVAEAATNTTQTGWLPINGTLKGNETLPATVTVNNNGKDFTFTVKYAKDAAGKQTTTKGSEAKYAQFTLTTGTNLADWKDNGVAEGEMSNKATDHSTVNTIKVSLTKTMPTPAYTLEKHKYSWRAGQKVDNVFTAYLYNKSDGSRWGVSVSSGFGYKNLTAALSEFEGSLYEYVVVNAAEKTEGDKKFFKNELITTGAYPIMPVSNAEDAEGVKLIDNTTERTSRIQYNYGKISSENKNNNYTVTVEDFKTVFACPLHKEAQIFAFEKKLVTAATSTTPAVYADVNVITYGDNTGEHVDVAKYLKATNKFDSYFNGAFNAIYGLFYKNWGATAKLVSKSNNNEDYFNVTITDAGEFDFAPVPDTSNPTADVPSTLILTLKDAFGHENEYKLDFIVKSRKATE